MATKLLVRRGTASALSSLVLDAGEPGWASDSKLLVVGDGSTAGGKRVAMLDVAQAFTQAQTINVASGTVQTWQVDGATKMILDGSGNLGIGVTPTADNGLLQLGNATTTKAGAVAWGPQGAPDTFIYRSAAGTIELAGTAYKTIISGRYLEIGVANGSTADENCIIDLHASEATQSDYSARIIRDSGVNGNLDIVNSGGGSFRLLTSGTLALTVDTSQRTTCNGDLILAAKLITTFGTPASASAAGTAGQVIADTNYIYICTATNTWKRVAIATW